MTTREIQTDDGTTWTLAAAAATDPGHDGRATVVATPSGGAQTLRLALDPAWHDGASDDDLAAAIEAARG